MMGIILGRVEWGEEKLVRGVNEAGANEGESGHEVGRGEGQGALVYFEYYRLFISAIQVLWKLEWVKRTGGRERVKYRATFEHTKPPPCTCSSRTHPASHQRARAFAFL